ncbi:hypothetical protein G1H10_31935 [Phytoactinopolyspora halotolerans]|uniref:Uncharacterized protein n=2 Tax=Phytoactinopolyspora halotolerans TaxID=1981512 RepID=A0A6L9SK78_9ACTN|nr:hypothetical protein [Phytoactinopolyspora halotolerans]
MDNHFISGPIFRAYGADGYAPLPEWVLELVTRVRAATLTAVAHARPGLSHIFTDYLSNDPEEERYLRLLRSKAAGRGAQFVPVWLTCPEDELLRRAVSPARSEGNKLRDPDELSRILNSKGILPPPDDALVLDTSAMSPREAAQCIIDVLTDDRPRCDQS